MTEQANCTNCGTVDHDSYDCPCHCHGDEGPSKRRSAAYYGNLCKVAVDFHVRQGTALELEAAYWYARYAARAVLGGVMP